MAIGAAKLSEISLVRERESINISPDFQALETAPFAMHRTEQLHESIEHRLYRLRIGAFHSERRGDTERFLAPLREAIRTDENVRALFINRIAGGIDSPAKEFFHDEGACLEVLLEEFPDSAQARYLLNFYAFEPQGEDGTYTQTAHRIFARKFPNDLWFRRQVEQFGGTRHASYKDLSSSDADLIGDWATTDPKYLPICMAVGHVKLGLCYHPTFDLDEYDLPDALRADCAAIQREPDLHARLKAAAAQPNPDWRLVNALRCLEASSSNTPAAPVTAEAPAATPDGVKADQSYEQLRDCAENATSPHQQAMAITALADGFADRSEVKEFLIEKILCSPTGSPPGTAALRSLTWHFPNDPRTQEVLLNLAAQENYPGLATQLFDYVSDPEYTHWLKQRAQWKTHFKKLFNNPTGDNAYEASRGAHALALWFGDDEDVFAMHEQAILFKKQLMAFCLRNLVARWRENPRTLRIVQAALADQDLNIREKAACLLSRAYSTHPDTARLLQERFGESPVILGEYLGLRMGDLDAMAEGLAVLANLAENDRREPLAHGGPEQLLRYFGPRKDLFTALSRLSETTANKHLRQAIQRALQQFYPHRTAVILQVPDAEAKIKTLSMIPYFWDECTREQVLAMCQQDPDPKVRLAAVEVLATRYSRAPAAPVTIAAAKELVTRGIPGAIAALGKLCPNDDDILKWLLQTIGSIPASPISCYRELTTTICDSFATSSNVRSYLLERLNTIDEMELHSVVRGLTQHYHTDLNTRDALDQALGDPRFSCLVDTLLLLQTTKLPSKQALNHLVNTLHASLETNNYPLQNAVIERLRSISYDQFAHGSSEERLLLKSLIGLLDVRHKRAPQVADTLERIMKASAADPDRQVANYPGIWEALRRWRTPQA